MQSVNVNLLLRLLERLYDVAGCSAVAEWLTAPDTQYLLDLVRPDLLMLRIISRGLVMWHDVHPSLDWINGNLPQVARSCALTRSACHTLCAICCAVTRM